MTLISVVASYCRFNVEVHADFPSRAAISTRKIIGGVAIDRDLVMNLKKVFLVCWRFAKIYSHENFPLNGRRSFIELAPWILLSLLVLCRLFFHTSKDFWLDINSISDGTNLWTHCLNSIFCEMNHLCLRCIEWSLIWATFHKLLMWVTTLDDFLILPLVSHLFPAYSGCLSMLASQLSNGAVSLGNWHMLNKPPPAHTMPVICVAAQPLTLVIETQACCTKSR